MRATSANVRQPNLVIKWENKAHDTNLPTKDGAKDIASDDEGQNTQRGPQTDDRHGRRDRHSRTPQMAVGWPRGKDEWNQMDQQNNHVGPQDRQETRGQAENQMG